MAQLSSTSGLQDSLTYMYYTASPARVYVSDCCLTANWGICQPLSCQDTFDKMIMTSVDADLRSGRWLETGRRSESIIYTACGQKWFRFRHLPYIFHIKPFIFITFSWSHSSSDFHEIFSRFNFYFWSPSLARKRRKTNMRYYPEYPSRSWHPILAP